MTTIVARQLKGDVEFASDTQFTDGRRKSPNSIEKVFRRGPVVFAACGTVRALNVLRFMDVPDCPKSLRGDDVDEWVVTKLVPEMQKALTDAKALVEHDGEVNSNSGFLIAVNGRAYEISSDFAVTREASGVYADGSGSSYALGAIHAGADLKSAVEIAAKLDPYTGGRVTVARYSEMVS